MERFGTDRPDMRFGMELKEINDIVKSTDFRVYKTIIENKGSIKALKE